MAALLQLLFSSRMCRKLYAVCCVGHLQASLKLAAKPQFGASFRSKCAWKGHTSFPSAILQPWADPKLWRTLSVRFSRARNLHRKGLRKAFWPVATQRRTGPFDCTMRANLSTAAHNCELSAADWKWEPFIAQLWPRSSPYARLVAHCEVASAQAAHNANRRRIIQ